MAEKKKNLSDHTSIKITNPKEFKIGILVSEWNSAITRNLQNGAVDTLLESGVPKENILIHVVPGSFELPSAAVMMLEADHMIDAVICLGCIIQGETRHFEFISQAVANGITQAAMDYNTPVIFGVLTCDNMQQAEERSGGKHGNKGVEAAYSCLKMLELERRLKN